RHGDDEVEAVEERTGQLLSVRGESLRRAATLDCRIAATAAGAQIHGSHEEHASREERVPADPGDRDDTVLERLPQCLEHWSRELRQLVEQEDAPVRERDLAGSWAWPSTDDRRRRRAVVRRSERRLGDERTLRRKEADDRVDARHLQRSAHA